MYHTENPELDAARWEDGLEAQQDLFEKLCEQKATLPENDPFTMEHLYESLCYTTKEHDKKVEEAMRAFSKSNSLEDGFLLASLLIGLTTSLQNQRIEEGFLFQNWLIHHNFNTFRF